MGRRNPEAVAGVQFKGKTGKSGVCQTAMARRGIGMKMKFIASCALAASLLPGAWTAAAAPEGETLPERARNAYDAMRPHTYLRINQGETVEEFKYKSEYVPIRDLFAGRVDKIKWNGKTKTAEVVHGGKTLVFNFSDSELEGTDTKIVLPKEWIRLSDGKAEIHAAVLAYLFDREASYAIEDEERDEWRERLSFLGIKETSALPGVRDDYLYIYLTFGEKSSRA